MDQYHSYSQCNQAGPYETFPDRTPPISSACLLSVENLSLLGIPRFLKNKFNQRQTEKQTVRQGKIIFYPLNKIKTI